MNLHVVIGEDDFLVARVAEKIVGDGVGLEVIDSLNATNADLQLADLRRADESLSTPPFLDPRKVTWWKNVHFLPSGGKPSCSEEVKEALEVFAKKIASASLPENQHFILSGPHLLKTSIFAKTLGSAAELVLLSPGKPWEAARAAVVRAIDLASEIGLRFEPHAAEKFVSIVGADTRSIVSELSKLRDYLGPAESVITSVAVDEIVSPGADVEPVLWDVTDAIGRRDLGAALVALRRFELENGFAVMMTTVIEGFFRQLVNVAEKRTDGVSPKNIEKSYAFLRNWSVAEARAASARFLALRERVVSGTNSGDVLVICELARVMRRRAARR